MDLQIFVEFDLSIHVGVDLFQNIVELFARYLLTVVLWTTRQTMTGKEVTWFWEYLGLVKTCKYSVKAPLQQL